MKNYRVTIQTNTYDYTVKAKNKTEAMKKAKVKHNKKLPSRMIDKGNSWVDEQYF